MFAIANAVRPEPDEGPPSLAVFRRANHDKGKLAIVIFNGVKILGQLGPPASPDSSSVPLGASCFVTADFAYEM